jgi:hypothetical protein
MLFGKCVALRPKILLLEKHLRKWNSLESKEEHRLTTVGSRDFSHHFDSRPATELDGPYELAAEVRHSTIRDPIPQPALRTLQNFVNIAADLEYWAFSNRIRHSIVGSARFGHST